MAIGHGDQVTSAPDDGVPALSVRGLGKVYGSGDGAVQALDDVSLQVPTGSIVGLLGHNGAGKTTLIKCILGLISPTDGTIELYGRDIEEHPDAVSEHAAAVLEGARNIYWRLTVRENLNFFARIAGHPPDEQRERHDRLLEQLGLLDRADTLVNELSRGMKQKVALAAMLAREPDLLFLDEPTMGLDVESSVTMRHEIDRIVDDDEMSVIVSSHNMDVIEELCDRVVIIDEGSVALDDTVASLRSLFDRRTVAVTIEGPLPPALERTLAAEFNVESIEAFEDRTRCHVRIDDARAVQSVLSRIFETNVRVVDVETARVDMEDIYLQVVGDEDPSDGNDATRTVSTYA